MLKPGPSHSRLLAAALVAGLAASAAGRDKEKLVPANFTHKQDALGFRWDINKQGTVNDGSNDCFDGGLVLTVNGSQFNAQSSMMTSDGREYVLSATISGVKVTRRILVDTVRGAARYIETFENPGKKNLKLSVVVRSRVGGSCQQVLTSGGAAFSGALGKKDVGILTVSQGSRPCVMFLVAGRRSTNRPAISNSGNRTFQFTYDVTAKVGGKVSLVHLVAQRRGVTAANVADTFKAFYKNRLIKPEIPARVRRTVINFRVAPGAGEAPGPLLGPVLELAESAGVERGKRDVLVVDEEAHLSGTVRCDGLEVETRYGKAQLALPEVALLAGGAGVGRPMRVYLRDGEILVGSVEAGEMTLETDSGMKVELSPARIDLLFTRPDPSDGKAAPGVAAFLETHLGERLALYEGRSAGLRAATAWGPLPVELCELKRLSRVREPQPLHRLVLRDKSRLFVALCRRPLAVETARFGPVRVPPHDITEFTRVRVKRAEARTVEETEAAEPEGLPPEIRRSLQEKVSFDFTDTPLSEAISFLQTLAKVNMILDPRAPQGNETPITLKGSRMSLKLALEKILKTANLRMRWTDGAIFVTAPPCATSSPPRELPPAIKSAFEKKVSFEFVETPLSEAISFLQTRTKVGMILDPKATQGLGPPINLKVSNMSLELSLRWILKLADLDLVCRDEGIFITKPGETEVDEGEDDEEEIKTPHCVLLGENLLVGAIDLRMIHVVTAAGVTPLEPGRIHLIERRGEDEGGVRPEFSFELISGGTLSGQLEERVLPIRWGERVLRVPVEHLVSAHVPKPEAGNAEEAGF